MAYDENGRYYFDPQVDDDDKESLAQLDRINQAALYRQRQMEAHSQNKFFSEAFSEALKEEGLTPEEYRILALEDKELPKSVKEGVKNMVRGVSQRGRSRSRDSEGRFMPGKERKPSSAKLSELKDRVGREGKLGESEAMDVLDAVLGSKSL